MLSRVIRLLAAGSLMPAAIALAPAIASACPACFAASGARGLHAYYLSTMLLSTMPFLLIGTIVTIAYVARRHASVKSVERLSED
ncbi:MAG: hypothetical protein ACLQDV_06415 [Candidatus Binataceae bacterium]